MPEAPPAKALLQPKSIRRKGMRPVELILEGRGGRQEVEISAVFQVLAKQAAMPMPCETIRHTVRVVLCSRDHAPSLATAHRQETGQIFLKPDGEFGCSFTDDLLYGRLYRTEFFDILAARWTCRIHEILEQETSTPGVS